jgi:hypothetical protein
MPLPQITVRKFKDGREVARFRDTQGLVRTAPSMVGNTGKVNLARWTRAEQMRELADYGIILQLQQCAAGLGSDGSPMPPLRRPKRSFGGRRDGVVQFNQKSIRNLYGTGRQGGHMLDAIRVNYVDDRKATYAITPKVQRDKARGNERRYPWWGWSRASLRKLRERSDAIFGTGVAERFFELGLIGMSALAFATRKLKRAA